MTVEQISFGELLKVYRERKGLNQRLLAEQLQVHYSLISRWERGVRFPSVTVLEKLNHALALNPIEQDNLEQARDYLIPENLFLNEFISLYIDRSGLSEQDVAQQLQIGRDRLREWRGGTRIPLDAELDMLIRVLQIEGLQAEKLRQAQPKLSLPLTVLQFILSANRQIDPQQINALARRGVVLG